jgi:cation transport regulator ChaC
MMEKYKIGILAYGSLIDDPGIELKPLIIDRIECITPFKVEYARQSRKRGFGPTLVPYTKAGSKVNASILIFNNDTSLPEVTSMLYRREIGVTDISKTYTHTNNPKKNTTQIMLEKGFMGVENILYTQIASNIKIDFNSDDLADLAIKSILTDAGEEKRDGIRYLAQNIKNNIITEYTEAYRLAILSKTDCSSLEEAIDLLDEKRNNQKE